MKTIFDRIVYLLNGFALALVSLAAVDFLLHPLATDFTYNSALYRAVSILVLTPLTLLVGFLIIRRVPGNIVGPLLILWAGTVAFGSVRKEIGPVPFALFTTYEVTIGWLALFALVLHFPDGKIYPPGAASWLYPQLGSWAILGMLINLSSSTMYRLANPFSLPALQKLNGFFIWLTILTGSPGMLMALVSPWLRYRKGSYRERQQIKWLALFGGVLVAGTILGFIVYPLITGGKMFSRENNLFSLLFFSSMALFPPLAIGLAVLRHHLWDIDHIIRRTLVYSILTAILTLIYFSSVVGLQELFQVFTGQHQSPVATVISTLAVAALFGRLIRPIQDEIDRRFYRKKYDAEKVLAGFSKTLRNEVDLDRLTNSILQVVEETTKPAHVSLWLREVDVQPSDRQSEENSSNNLSLKSPERAR